MMKKLQYCFWLVLLAHLLLFLSFAVTLIQLQQAPETPDEDAENSAPKPVPSYVYQEPQKPLMTAENQQPVASDGLIKPKNPAPGEPANTATKHDASAETRPTKAGTDPATVIANKKTDKLLIKLLSRATSKKLVYPKSAQDFRVTGKVEVRFYLTPDGQISDITLVGSSGSDVLDEAALNAVRATSPVQGVDAYLSNPKYLVVGIIFSA
jgi:protein TonB